MTSKNKKLTVLFVIGCICILVIAGAVGLVAGGAFKNRNKIAEGVKISGLDVGGLTKEEAQKKADTYIEYRILTERESDFAGNKNLTETYYLQVDIFSYGNYKKLAQTVKNTLKSKGYISLSTDGDLYEEDTKLYHKIMRFSYKKFI